MRNKLFVLVACFFAVCTVQAQTDSAAGRPDQVPAFKGGLNAWTLFLQSNLDHGLMGKNNAPEGRYTTLASFIVDSVGGVRDIIIERDPGYGAADEMIRMLKKSSKKWIPAMKNGVAVSYRHRQSLTLISSGF